MNEIQRELLDIVTQVRAQLEYQKALGVTAIMAPLHEHRSTHETIAVVPPVISSRAFARSSFGGKRAGRRVRRLSARNACFNTP